MKDATALPPSVLDFCEKAARHWNLNLSAKRDQEKIAQSILRLSDFFIHQPQAATPWPEIWAQQAYVFYFLPLNSIRLSRIFSHIEEHLEKIDIAKFVDFGAGLATASRLFAKEKYQLQLIEKATEPQNLVKEFDSSAKNYLWSKEAPTLQEMRGSATLSCFSYSLTELNELPPWAFESRGLLIVEPSIQQDGRKLLQLREKLISRGYHILAPCTHQQACPLLHQSKNDWCHDRVHTLLPEWMQKIEEYLPMKNRTLTMSYLFAVQKEFCAGSVQNPAVARVTGDLLKEKGKDRQLICRGPDREFLAWLHKHGEHEEVPRGVLVDIPEEALKVSNELRVPGGVPVKIKN